MVNMTLQMSEVKKITISESCVDELPCRHKCVFLFNNGKKEDRVLDINKISGLLHEIVNQNLPVKVEKQVSIEGIEKTLFFNFKINFNHFYFPQPPKPWTFRSVYNFFSNPM